MANDAASTGIIPRKYKSGSIIYFEGDKSESIYILKSGKVILTSQKLDTGEEIKEEVKHGEFFGVKSAIGKYPREETAQTIGETVVLVIHLSAFERLVLKNPNVVRKMLRVFSNQLRRIHKMVRSVMGEGDTINPDVELFRIGEYYYKTGVFEQAEYAFKRLLEHYPDSQYASIAMEKIKAINTGEALPGGDSFSMDINMDNDKPDMSDFQLDDSGDNNDFGESFDSSPAENGTGDFLDFDTDSSSGGDAHSDLTDEMDSFLSDDNNDFSFDDYSDEKTILEISDEANTLLQQEKYSEALQIYEQVLQKTSFKNANEEDAFEKAHLEAGKCHLQLKKPKEALNLFSTLVKKYPNSAYQKETFYNIGLVFEVANQKDKAVAYFNKVLNMQPKDNINAEAMNKIKALQN